MSTAQKQICGDGVNVISNKITFSCQAALRTRGHSLVISGASIQARFPGGLSAFFLNDVGFGITNGSLFVLNAPPSRHNILEEFIHNQLVLHGLVERRDYVTGTTGMYPHEGETTRTGNPKISWCEGIPWLESAITARGHFVRSDLFQAEIESFRSQSSAKSNRVPSHWWYRFRQHPVLRNCRLKCLDSGNYLPEEMSPFLTRNVGALNFFTQEAGRIPCFIGTQFGVHPPLHKFPEHFTKPLLVGVFAKSALSGAVAGFSFYLLEKSGLWVKVYSLSNMAIGISIDGTEECHRNVV